MTQAGRATATRRTVKSSTAFRTTGEVAEALDLPAHVLRFWETKFPEVKPLKRGGGRRYYRPEDVDLLRRIRQHLYQRATRFAEFRSCSVKVGPAVKRLGRIRRHGRNFSP